MEDESDTPARAARKRRVTSSDVAREAGVSRATVSYVLNKVEGERITDETRKRVLEAAQRLGHVPNATARALRLGRTNLVLALVGDFTFGYVRDRVLEDLSAEMTRRGYALLVHRHSEELMPLKSLWPLISPDVIVVMGGMPSDMRSSIPEGSRFVQVQPLLDQQRAGRMQVEYLVSKGHRRLAYAYPTNEPVRVVADERLAGSRDACERLGIAYPAVERVDRLDGGSISRAIDHILEGQFTAVCAHNDEIAVMLSLEISRRGLQVGKDLAVIGIDNTPTSSLGLTTVGIDVEIVTRLIVSRVVALIEGRPIQGQDAEDFLRVLERESA